MLRKQKEEVVPSTSSDSTLTTTKKNKKWNNKRRFSDAQIKLMESMFETESKLEQNAKIQLAKELDLQPRQVAIWFQNRRARWKSKQLERDYKLLKANYDALATQYESIKKEKQMLLMQCLPFVRAGCTISATDQGSFLLIQAIQGDNPSAGEIFHYVEDVNNLSSNWVHVVFNHAPRTCNTTAHCIAVSGKGVLDDHNWFARDPPWLIATINLDRRISN